ncbi:hypothetical protein KCA1_1108 [Lactiplantibacillus pentosus KCA1]|nr:hypothetical protein KCA1_1108 [Lactiplantibacillus pentosus KCA1]
MLNFSLPLSKEERSNPEIAQKSPKYQIILATTQELLRAVEASGLILPHQSLKWKLTATLKTDFVLLQAKHKAK